MYFDPSEGSYDELLDVFFQRTDPTTLNRQGNDRGTQYRRWDGGARVLAKAAQPSYTRDKSDDVETVRRRDRQRR